MTGNEHDKHMKSKHSGTDFDSTAILQVDGNISIPVSDDLNDSTASHGLIRSNPVITRTAPFTLNPSKQLTSMMFGTYIPRY